MINDDLELVIAKAIFGNDNLWRSIVKSAVEQEYRPKAARAIQAYEAARDHYARAIWRPINTITPDDSPKLCRRVDNGEYFYEVCIGKEYAEKSFTEWTKLEPLRAQQTFKESGDDNRSESEMR